MLRLLIYSSNSSIDLSLPRNLHKTDNNFFDNLKKRIIIILLFIIINNPNTDYHTQLRANETALQVKIGQVIW